MGRQTYSNSSARKRGRAAAVKIYVNDLEALLEKLVSLVGQVVLDAVLRSAIRLVNVDSLPRPAELSSPIADVGRCAADCVVKDENAGCSGAEEGCQDNGDSLFEQGVCSHVFQELFHFRVVSLFDLRVVEEILLLACVFHKLEAVAIKAIFILVSSDIVDCDALGGVWAQIIG